MHCRTREQAERVRQAVQERLARCKLEVHPSKTKIVYCQDSNRRASYPETSFEFLSFTFRPRRARDRRGAYFVSFSPAVSRGAAKRIRQEMRRSWRLPRRTDKALTDLAHMFNPVQPHPGLVGHAEVQAVEGASPAGGALAGPDRPAAADAVRSLAAPRGEADGWLIGAV